MGSPDKRRAKLIDLRHPFFNQVWRRVVMTIFTGGWAMYEFASAAPFWGILFGSLSVWCAWTFFVTWGGPIEDADDV